MLRVSYMFSYISYMFPTCPKHIFINLRQILCGKHSNQADTAWFSRTSGPLLAYFSKEDLILMQFVIT